MTSSTTHSASPLDAQVHLATAALLWLLAGCARTGFQPPPIPRDAGLVVDAGPTEGQVVDTGGSEGLAGDAAGTDALAADAPVVDGPGLDTPANDADPGDADPGDASLGDAGSLDLAAQDLVATDGQGPDAPPIDAATIADSGGATDAAPLEDVPVGPDVEGEDAAAPPLAGRLAINAGAASSSTFHVALQLEEPDNALARLGSVPDTLASWTITANGGDGWVTEGRNPFGETAFTTSFDGCIRTRTIDLLAAGFTRAELDAQPPVAVREWIVGVWPQYGDLYYVHLELRRNASDGTLASFDHGTATAAMSATDTWQAIGATFTGYGASARYLYIEDGGRDIEYWAGYYGTRMGALAIHVGTVEVRLRNDGGAWGPWLAFSPEGTIAIEPAQPGLHTVRAQFRDGSGAILGEATDSIVVDCTPTCGANAHCDHGSEPYVCACDLGFTGDGYTCTPE